MDQQSKWRSHTAWLVVKVMLFAVALVAVIYFGFMTKPSLPRGLKQIGVNDLMLHGLGFAVLSFIALLGAVRVWLIILLLLVFAAALEISQIVQPHRNVGLDDFIANLIGVGIGWASAIVAAKILARHS